MRILVLTLGTRGDLELFLLLACTLAARGHSPHMVTSHFHAGRVAASGIEQTAIGSETAACFDEILSSLGAMSDLRARTIAYVNRFLRPELAAATPALQKLTATADYFVSNLKITVTRNGQILPTAFVTYDPPATLGELDRYSATLPRERILELVAFPRALVDPGARWPDRFRFTSFWLPTDAPPPLSAPLTAFLAGGPPPVALTTGSMRGVDPARLTRVFADAVARMGHRGLLLNSPPPAAATRLFAVGEVPYRSLFPHLAAVIHHGGVGTTAETLRAGVPSILLPQILAQSHMATLLAQAGLAGSALDPASVTAEQLTAAIAAATTYSRWAGNRARFRERIAGEPGVVAAATEIERHAATMVNT